MQPLSRVKPDAITEWGDPNTMTLRPILAAKVARCIAQWAEIEVHLGGFLGLLLHANQKAALAMYSGLENRAAQLRMIMAAAKASVPPDHFDVISVLFSATIRPVMKERDRFAHWAWGHSTDMTDALLIAEPEQTLKSLMDALRVFPGVERAAIPTNFDRIWVIRESDLDGVIARSVDAKTQLRFAMGTVWEHNAPAQRAEHLRQLSNAPQVRAGLDRLARDRQKTQEAPSQSFPSEPNG